MNGLFHSVIPKKSTQDHLKIIGRVLDSSICTICHDYMFVPVMTSCGHNYCYECLSNWLNNNRTTLSELTCPQCRGVIKNEPVLNVMLQQMVDLMLEILSVGPEQNARELRTMKESRDISIAEYKADLCEETLYKNIFSNTAEAIIDEDDDGIARCGNCHWELEGPVCPNCNAQIRNYTDGAQNVDEIDPEEYSEGELEDVERDLDNYRAESARRVHDLEADEDRSLSDEMDHAWPIRRPASFLHRSESVGLDGDDDDDEDDDRDRDDEDAGSIDSFIVDDEDNDDDGSPHKLTPVLSLASHSDNDNDIDSRDSDFYEHNDEGYASGDSLNESTSNDELEPRDEPRPRKKRLVILDSDE